MEEKHPNHPFYRKEIYPPGEPPGTPPISLHDIHERRKKAREGMYLVDQWGRRLEDQPIFPDKSYTLSSGREVSGKLLGAMTGLNTPQTYRFVLMTAGRVAAHDQFIRPILEQKEHERVAALKNKESLRLDAEWLKEVLRRQRVQQMLDRWQQKPKSSQRQ